MRSILLHIHDDECLDARLQVALDLARAFEGHLTCLQAAPFEIGVPGDLHGMMTGDLLQELRRTANRLRAQLEDRLTGEDVASEWVQVDGRAVDQVLRRAGLSDLVVLGSCEPLSRRGPALLTGDVILRARTPVLVVPPQTKRFDCGGPAVVAWDGSPEASRALRGAVPLLARASAVTLVTIGEYDKAFDLPPIEGAEYLSRHGIGCEMSEVPLRGGSIGEALAEAAVSHGAAYLVMGAYGHSRLFETLWGGVTRHLLTDPPIPILASH